MTTIAAKQDEDGIHFAWDSQVTTGNNALTQINKTYSFFDGRVVVGVSGYLRTCNLVQTMEFSKLYEEGQTNRSHDTFDADKWMTEVFAVEVFDRLEKAKCVTVTNGMYEGGGQYIVSVLGNVYRVGPDFAWSQAENGLYTIGSGYAFALGAMAVGASPATAVEVASRFNEGTNSCVSTLDVPNVWA